MATLKDIADSCDYSVSLVSKVLNNRMGNSTAKPEVIAAIHQAAKDLGYRKNQSAAALRSGRHDVIGVLMYHFGRPGSDLAYNMVRSIAQECRKNKQRQSLTFFDGSDEFHQSAREYHSGTMDGVLIAGLPVDELIDDIKKMHQAGLPMVTVHSENHMGDDIPNVGIDEAAITRIATEHLLENGCKNLVHIGKMQARHDGFVTAMKNAGMPLTDRQMMTCNYTGDHAIQAIKQFEDHQVPFDGIVTQSDEQAAGLLTYLLAKGIRIPQDVRIIGVDNSPYCKYLPVPLSSVAQLPKERGELAVKILNRCIAGEKNIASFTFQPQLIIRHSTT